MNHRGACSCDNDSGDGAGVLTAIPHSFYAHELRFANYNFNKISENNFNFFNTGNTKKKKNDHINKLTHNLL